MSDPILTYMNQHMILLNTAAAFVCGACLMYLVLARTLKKRRRDERDLAEVS